MRTLASFEFVLFDQPLTAVIRRWRAWSRLTPSARRDRVNVSPETYRDPVPAAGRNTFPHLSESVRCSAVNWSPDNSSGSNLAIAIASITVWVLVALLRIPRIVATTSGGVLAGKYVATQIITSQSATPCSP